MVPVRRLWFWTPLAIAGLAVGLALLMHDWRRPAKSPPETAPLHVPTSLGIPPYHQTPDAKAAYKEGFRDGSQSTYLNPENLVMPQAEP